MRYTKRMEKKNTSWLICSSNQLPRNQITLRNVNVIELVVSSLRGYNKSIPSRRVTDFLCFYSKNKLTINLKSCLLEGSCLDLTQNLMNEVKIKGLLHMNYFFCIAVPLLVTKSYLKIFPFPNTTFKLLKYRDKVVFHGICSKQSYSPITTSYFLHFLFNNS